jgi:esterase
MVRAPTMPAMHQAMTLATRDWPPAAEADVGAPAPVAVLVHGITGWGRTWWRVAPALAARGWHAVALDLRGHGDSPPIDGVVSVGELGSDVEATLDGLGLEGVDVLVGHSLGAATAMELAHRRPQLARRLILEDPPGSSRVDDVEFQATLERETLAARSDPEAELRRVLAENPTWAEEDALQDVGARARCDRAGILASLRAGTGIRAVDLVAELVPPALYLLADASRSALGARRSELIGAVPSGSEVVEFDSGHTVHRDRFDEYVVTVMRWLDRT